jgi:hypothetical protein
MGNEESRLSGRDRRRGWPGVGATRRVSSLRRRQSRAVKTGTVKEGKRGWKGFRSLTKPKKQLKLEEELEGWDAVT